jgi:hypothetical protein
MSLWALSFSPAVPQTFRCRQTVSGAADLLLIGTLAMPEPRVPGVRYLGFLEEAEKCAAMAGAKAVIPPKSNRKKPRDYDKHLYKERNLVERFLNKVKNCRRVATRYEKTARNYLAFWQLASIMVLLA